MGKGNNPTLDASSMIPFQRLSISSLARVVSSVTLSDRERGREQRWEFGVETRFALVKNLGRT